MNAAEYHEVFARELAEPLRPHGWVMEKRCLFRRDGRSVAALLRCPTKYSSLDQCMGYLLCFGHDFLRDLEREPIVGFAYGPSLYPVKLAPAKAARFLDGGQLRGWRYTPINLNLPDVTTIDYGSSHAAGVAAALAAIRDVLLAFAPPFQKFFTPAAALRQIRTHGENAYCERIWIEDYERFLATDAS